VFIEVYDTLGDREVIGSWDLVEQVENEFENLEEALAENTNSQGP